MYVSSISPLPKTKPKFPFRYIVALIPDSRVQTRLYKDLLKKKARVSLVVLKKDHSMYKCLFTGDGHEITDPNWVILQERPSFFSDRILGPSNSHHGSFVNSACHYRTKKSVYPSRTFTYHNSR